MSETVSYSIKILRTFSIFLILLLHSRTGIDFSQTYIANIADIISRGFGSLGVPIFLAISGYLSSIKIRNNPHQSIWKNFTQRAKGFLISYFFWNTLIAGLAILLIKLTPHTGYFLNEKISGGFLSIYGINEKFPISYQFWFIRELLIFSLAFTIFELIEKHVEQTYILATIGIIGLSFFLEERTAIALISYTLGYLSARNKMLSVIQNFPARKIKFLLIYLCTISTISLVTASQTGNWSGMASNIFITTGSVSLIIGVIHIANLGWRSNYLSSISTATFFIFAAHEPLLTLVKKILTKSTNQDFAYLFSPIFVFFFLIFIFRNLPNNKKEEFWFVFNGIPPKK